MANLHRNNQSPTTIYRAGSNHAVFQVGTPKWWSFDSRIEVGTHRKNEHNLRSSSLHIYSYRNINIHISVYVSVCLCMCTSVVKGVALLVCGCARVGLSTLTTPKHNREFTPFAQQEAMESAQKISSCGFRAPFRWLVPVALSQNGHSYKGWRGPFPQWPITWLTRGLIGHKKRDNHH